MGVRCLVEESGCTMFDGRDWCTMLDGREWVYDVW